MSPTDLEDIAPQRARRADALANRAHILATAQRLFAERGVEQVCMAAIAEAAGVGKGTLYRGFANKGQLCLALMAEDAQAFQRDSRQLLKAMAGQPALTRLDAFLDRLVHFMDCHAALLREVPGQNPEPPAECSAAGWLPWLQSTLTLLLRQAADNGETGPLDLPYLVDAILALFQADLFLYQRHTLGFSLERISQGARQLVLHGVSRPE